MMRERYSLLIFYILLEILLNHSCVPVTGNDLFNPFNLQSNKKTEMENSKFSENEILEDPSKEKIIEKRRYLVKGNDLNTPVTTENEYWSRRKNYSETENEKQISEHHEEFNNWENGRSRLSFPLDSGNSEVHSRQPFTKQINSNQHYNWERSDILDKSQSRLNEEKSFKQFSNPEWNTGSASTRIHSNERPSTVINNSEKKTFSENGDDLDFDRRASITTLNSKETENAKNYNNEIVTEMSSGYLGHPNKNYYNRNLNGFWNPNFYKPEKGVIINFNTECPTPRQFNSHLVHKFIFTPKSPISIHPDMSGFQIPEANLFSAPRMTPMYY